MNSFVDLKPGDKIWYIFHNANHVCGFVKDIQHFNDRHIYHIHWEDNVDSELILTDKDAIWHSYINSYASNRKACLNAIARRAFLYNIKRRKKDY